MMLQPRFRGTTIHFAGMNTAWIARVLEGRPVLMSYADVKTRPGVWESEILPRLRRRAYPSVMLDSGAFTVYAENLRRKTKGLPPQPLLSTEEYGAFAVEHKGLFDYVVTMDDIAGDLAVSQANTAALESMGLRVVPVFHQGEPWGELVRLVGRYGVIGVGFQRPIRGAREFLDAFFQVVGGRCRVHGFAMTRYAMEGYRFDTTDSTTWIAERRGLQSCEGDHRIEPFLQLLLREMSKDDAAELVLSSYEQDSYMAGGFDDRNAWGQARTVLGRFSEGSWQRLAERVESLRRASCMFDGNALVER